MISMCNCSLRFMAGAVLFQQFKPDLSCGNTLFIYERQEIKMYIMFIDILPLAWICCYQSSILIRLLLEYMHQQGYCGGLNMYGLPRLLCFDNCSPVGRTFGEGIGSVALLKGVCYWVALGFKNLCHSQCLSQPLFFS